MELKRMTVAAAAEIVWKWGDLHLVDFMVVTRKDTYKH